jgi:hypothetical protein
MGDITTNTNEIQRKLLRNISKTYNPISWKI